MRYSADVAAAACGWPRRSAPATRARSSGCTASRQCGIGARRAVARQAEELVHAVVPDGAAGIELYSQTPTSEVSSARPSRRDSDVELMLALARARGCAAARSSIRWRAMNSGTSTSATARASSRRNGSGLGSAASQPPVGRAEICQEPGGQRDVGDHRMVVEHGVVAEEDGAVGAGAVRAADGDVEAEVGVEQAAVGVEPVGVDDGRDDAPEASRPRRAGDEDREAADEAVPPCTRSTGPASIELCRCRGRGRPRSRWASELCCSRGPAASRCP